MTPTSLDLPIAMRVGSVVCGTLLMLAALRLAVRGGRWFTPGTLGGRVVVNSARIAARLTPLHRMRDVTSVPTRLALAPDCWAARWIGAGIGADESHPPDLRRLIAGVRLVSAAACAAPVALVALAAFPAPSAVVIAALALAVGATLPDLALGAAARKARRAGVDDAAASVDMLAATASAGLSLPEAMVLTAGHAPPAVAAALRAAAVRRAMGEDARTALCSETQRYGVASLADVAQAVERQQRLGVPLGPELHRIAERVRAEHRTAALRRAARRGPLGTIAVALLIAPLCVAVVIACLVGGIAGGGGL